jgi:nitroreductase
MDVQECILKRRSIRVYKEDPVPAEMLAKVLEAAQWAPSWVNLQVWEIVVVDDREVMKQLAGCVMDANPGKKALGMAPLVLAMCGRQGKSGYYGPKPSTVYGDWVMFDVGIAAQNICLAAWALGLGSLHLGLLDHAAAGKVLGLPEDVKLYELIPLGFPLKEGKAPPRKAVKDFTHKNRFGTPAFEG